MLLVSTRRSTPNRAEPEPGSGRRKTRRDGEALGTGRLDNFARAWPSRRFDPNQSYPSGSHIPAQSPPLTSAQAPAPRGRAARAQSPLPARPLPSSAVGDGTAQKTLFILLHPTTPKTESRPRASRQSSGSLGAGRRRWEGPSVGSAQAQGVSREISRCLVTGGRLSAVCPGDHCTRWTPKASSLSRRRSFLTQFLPFSAWLV